MLKNHAMDFKAVQMIMALKAERMAETAPSILAPTESFDIARGMQVAA